jgi:hypothetical protein
MARMVVVALTGTAATYVAAVGEVAGSLPSTV